MSRAYIRLDPGFFERKVIEQEYAPGEAMALVGAFCLAEQQTPRGRFRNERVLRALLGQYGRHVPSLVARGDLVVLEDRRVYIEGWDEWQEGDVTVKERMARIRNRNRRRNPDRNPTVPPRLGSSSTSSQRDEAELTPAPAGRGRRKDGTNPRAQGSNPRADGTNPREVERDRKHGPSRIGELFKGDAAEALIKAGLDPSIVGRSA